MNSKFEEIYRAIVSEGSYKEGNGKYQEKAEELWNKLRDKSSLASRIMEAANSLYIAWSWHDDTDRVKMYMSYDSNDIPYIVRCYGFLCSVTESNTSNLDLAFIGHDLKLMADADDEEYGSFVEDLCDCAVCYADKHQDDETQDYDLLDRRYAEKAAEVLKTSDSKDLADD